jgi:hypothetical protein
MAASQPVRQPYVVYAVRRTFKMVWDGMARPPSEATEQTGLLGQDNPKGDVEKAVPPGINSKGGDMGR